MTRGRPPLVNPKSAHLHLRLHSERLAAYREAAARADLSLTAWVEMVLDAATSTTPESAADIPRP
jgi:predicted HicB family RNase H-like nuclease